MYEAPRSRPWVHAVGDPTALGARDANPIAARMIANRIDEAGKTRAHVADLDSRPSRALAVNRHSMVQSRLSVSVPHITSCPEGGKRSSATSIASSHRASPSSRVERGETFARFDLVDPERWVSSATPQSQHGRWLDQALARDVLRCESGARTRS
jgi:hypothetical protein